MAVAALNPIQHITVQWCYQFWLCCKLLSNHLLCVSLFVYRVALYAGLAFVRATGTLIRTNGIILYQLNLPLPSFSYHYSPRTIF